MQGLCSDRNRNVGGDLATRQQARRATWFVRGFFWGAAASLIATAALAQPAASPNAPPAAGERVFYVSLSGDDSNDGLSWRSAKLSPQSGINAANSAGGGTVQIGAGTFNMGSTSLNHYPQVRLVGQGQGATWLQWTGVPANGALVWDNAGGTYNSSLRDLRLTFTASASAATAIRIHGYSGPNVFAHNLIEHVRIEYDTLVPGSIGINATSDGKARGTQVYLNSFSDVKIIRADQAVVCTGCEGDHWELSAFFTGLTAHPIVTFGTAANGAPTNDEVGELRIENENSGPTACFSVSGHWSQLRVVCDSNFALPAVVDTGGHNIFDVSAVGPPTLGTIPFTSSYRYANDASQQAASVVLANSGGGLTLASAEVTITPAQMRALSSAPITIVPAQGPGTMIVPVAVTMEYVFGTVPYTPGNGHLVIYTSGNWTNVFAQLNEAGFVDQAASKVTVPPISLAVSSQSAVANRALILAVNGTDLTRGDGTMRVTVLYKVLTVAM